MSANSSRFKKGYDPRRAVHQSKGIQVFRDTLAEHMRKLSLDAVAYVQSVLNDEKAPQKLRLIAAQEIMNRSWGLPVNSMVIQTLDSSEGSDPAGLTTEELERIVLRLATNKGKVIEAEVVEIEAPTYSDNDAKNSLKESGIDV